LVPKPGIGSRTQLNPPGSRLAGGFEATEGGSHAVSVHTIQATTTHELLAPVYGWFIEVFDALDLKRAAINS
jgi:hypothetical protein